MFKRFAELRAQKHARATRSPLDIARGMIAARRALQRHLPVHLLHDPSLDMLLALFVGEHEGVAMGGAELATTTTVGPAIAAHLIKAMAALGMIEEDVTITLTAQGRSAVATAIAAVGAAQMAPDYARRPRLRMLYQRDQHDAAMRVTSMADPRQPSLAGLKSGTPNQQRLTVQ